MLSLRIPLDICTSASSGASYALSALRSGTEKASVLRKTEDKVSGPYQKRNRVRAIELGGRLEWKLVNGIRNGIAQYRGLQVRSNICRRLRSPGQFPGRGAAILRIGRGAKELSWDAARAEAKQRKFPDTPDGSSTENCDDQFVSRGRQVTRAAEQDPSGSPSWLGWGVLRVPARRSRDAAGDVDEQRDHRGLGHCQSVHQLAETSRTDTGNAENIPAIGDRFTGW